MDPLIGSALIGGGVSMLSGLFGGNASDKASKRALQAQRETNAQNYKIWQEQKQHNIDMYNMQMEDQMEMYNLQKQDNIDFWNMQNEYNDLESQVERAREAGFSPMAVLGGGGTTAGNIESPGMNQPQMQQAQAPTMQTPPSEAFQNSVAVGIQTALSTATQMAQAFDTAINAVPKAQNTQAQTGLFTAQADQSKAMASKLGLESEYQKMYNTYAPDFLKGQLETQKLGLQFEKETLQSRIEQQRNIVDLQNLDKIYKGLQNEQQEFANQYLGFDKMREIYRDTLMNANLIAQNKLTYAQAKESLSREVANYAQANYTNSLRTQVQQEIEIRKATGALESQEALLALAGLPTQENLANLDYNQLRKLADEMGLPKGISIDQMSENIADKMMIGQMKIHMYNNLSGQNDAYIGYLTSDQLKNHTANRHYTVGRPSRLTSSANVILETLGKFIPFASMGKSNNYYNNSVLYPGYYD